jgi:hypothetical protein
MYDFIFESYFLKIEPQTGGKDREFRSGLKPAPKVGGALTGYFYDKIQGLICGRINFRFMECRLQVFLAVR